MKFTTETEVILESAEIVIPWRSLSFFAHANFQNNDADYSLAETEKYIRMFWVADMMGFTVEECVYAFYDNLKFREFCKSDVAPSIDALQQFFRNLEMHQVAGSILHTIKVVQDIHKSFRGVGGTGPLPVRANQSGKNKSEANHKPGCCLSGQKCTA